MGRRVFLVGLLSIACGRSGLELDEIGSAPDGLDPIEDSDEVSPDEDEVCEPSEEVCDAVDNDCDGQIDEGLPVEPCEGGGSRFCVGGSYSECPRPCDVCQPSSSRVCFLSYCTIWGRQRCDSDGRAWQPCQEEQAPAACREEDNKWGASPDSRESEECCIEQGECCEDHWDLDDDGDTEEMLGACDEVSCG